MAAPAFARSGAAERATARPPEFHLLRQAAWTALGGDLALDLAIPSSAADLSVRVTVHRAVSTRGAFDRTLRGEALGSTLSRTTAPIATLPPVAGGKRMTLQLPDQGASRGPNGVAVTRPGVYPLEVDLYDPDAGNSRASFVTYLVAVDPTAAATRSPLSVAWIWRIGTRPAMGADGNLVPEVTAQFGPGGRLARLGAALDGATDVPLTVAMVPETLNAWDQAATANPALRSTLAHVESGIRSHQSLSGPFVNLDMPSLNAAGFTAQINNEYVRGADELTRQIGKRADPRTAIVEPADAPTLARLRESNVDRVVIPAEAFEDADSKLTPAHPFTTPAGDGSMTVVSPDPVLSMVLQAPEDPALNAQRVLAGLALTTFEAPNLARGVALDAGANWSPPADLLAAMLAGLRGNPLVTPVTLDTLFDRVPTSANDAGPESRLLRPSTPGPPVITATDYDRAEADQRTLASLAPLDDPALAAGQRALYTALSSDWGRGPAARAQAMGQFTPVTVAIRRILSQIEVPSSKTVTLTSETGKLPLSFVNNTDRAISIKVQLVSSRLAFPNGSIQTVRLRPNATTTTTFEVQARTNGTFPLDILATTVDGRFPVQDTQITIRSTALNGVGLFLTIGAGVFLALWWITSWRRNRRKRHDAPTSGPTAVPTPAGKPE